MVSLSVIHVQMGSEIRLAREIIVALQEQAALAHPLEACGLLLGGADGAISRIQPCANVAPDPARHFEIDPAALIGAWRRHRAGEEALLGYYHSHPSGDSRPSPTDRAMAAHDGMVWAIVAGGQVGWFRDNTEGFLVLSTSLVSD
jgi:proteasome lid subunit RPN8/RPN11